MNPKTMVMMLTESEKNKQFSDANEEACEPHVPFYCDDDHADDVTENDVSAEESEDRSMVASSNGSLQSPLCVVKSEHDTRNLVIKFARVNSVKDGRMFDDAETDTDTISDKEPMQVDYVPSTSEVDSVDEVVDTTTADCDKTLTDTLCTAVNSELPPTVDVKVMQLACVAVTGKSTNPVEKDIVQDHVDNIGAASFSTTEIDNYRLHATTHNEKFEEFVKKTCDVVSSSPLSKCSISDIPEPVNNVSTISITPSLEEQSVKDGVTELSKRNNSPFHAVVDSPPGQIVFENSSTIMCPIIDRSPTVMPTEMTSEFTKHGSAVVHNMRVSDNNHLACKKISEQEERKSSVCLPQCSSVTDGLKVSIKYNYRQKEYVECHSKTEPVDSNTKAEENHQSNAITNTLNCFDSEQHHTIDNISGTEINLSMSSSANSMQECQLPLNIVKENADTSSLNIEQEYASELVFHNKVPVTPNPDEPKGHVNQFASECSITSCEQNKAIGFTATENDQYINNKGSDKLTDAVDDIVSSTLVEDQEECTNQESRENDGDGTLVKRDVNAAGVQYGVNNEHTENSEAKEVAIQDIPGELMEWKDDTFEDHTEGNIKKQEYIEELVTKDDMGMGNMITDSIEYIANSSSVPTINNSAMHDEIRKTDTTNSSNDATLSGVSEVSKPCLVPYDDDSPDSCCSDGIQNDAMEPGQMLQAHNNKSDPVVAEHDFTFSQFALDGAYDDREPDEEKSNSNNRENNTSEGKHFTNKNGKPSNISEQHNDQTTNIDRERDVRGSGGEASTLMSTSLLPEIVETKNYPIGIENAMTNLTELSNLPESRMLTTTKGDDIDFVVDAYVSNSKENMDIDDLACIYSNIMLKNNDDITSCVDTNPAHKTHELLETIEVTRCPESLENEVPEGINTAEVHKSTKDLEQSTRKSNEYTIDTNALKEVVQIPSRCVVDQAEGECNNAVSSKQESDMNLEQYNMHNELSKSISATEQRSYIEQSESVTVVTCLSQNDMCDGSKLLTIPANNEVKTKTNSQPDGVADQSIQFAVTELKTDRTTILEANEIIVTSINAQQSNEEKGETSKEYNLPINNEPMEVDVSRNGINNLQSTDFITKSMLDCAQQDSIEATLPVNDMKTKPGSNIFENLMDLSSKIFDTVEPIKMFKSYETKLDSEHINLKEAEIKIERIDHVYNDIEQNKSETSGGRLPLKMAIKQEIPDDRNNKQNSDLKEVCIKLERLSQDEIEERCRNIKLDRNAIPVTLNMKPDTDLCKDKLFTSDLDITPPIKLTIKQNLDVNITQNFVNPDMGENLPVKLNFLTSEGTMSMQLKEFVPHEDETFDATSYSTNIAGVSKSEDNSDAPVHRNVNDKSMETSIDNHVTIKKGKDEGNIGKEDVLTDVPKLDLTSDTQEIYQSDDDYIMDSDEEQTNDEEG